MGARGGPRAGSGRPGYGPRELVAVRPTVEQKRIYEERARAMGLSLSNWILLQLALAEGLPFPPSVEEDLAKARARRMVTGEVGGIEGGELPMQQSA